MASVLVIDDHKGTRETDTRPLPAQTSEIRRPDTVPSHSGAGEADSVSPDTPDSGGSLRAHPRVLVVDDEIQENDALVRLLAFKGFDVVCTPSGAGALAHVRSTPFDAMVLDLHLRDILGLQVLSELRGAGIALPIVVVTGWYFDDGREEACLAMGAGAFLQKPLDDSVLAAALRRVIAAKTIPTPQLACAPTDRGGSVHPRPSMEVRGVDGDALRVYHDRAVSGDDTAAERIVATLLPTLQQRLHKAFPTTPNDWIHDAVVDALREYHGSPARYDVSRGTSLSQFLLFAARRNVLNRRDAEARRRGHETIVPSAILVKLAGAAPERVLGECSTTIAVAEDEFTEAERTVLQLWRAGERRTRVYAEALGCGSSPFAEQRAHVKRIKDRVVQRVRRWARRDGDVEPKC